MLSNVLKAHCKPLLTLGLSVIALGSYLYLDQTPITFESEESKTAELLPVFNQVSFQRGKNKDIWSMKQSHEGINHPQNQWDSIKIEVDKSTTPPNASFYQLDENGKPISYKATCYLCHSNGPRAIRPNFNSTSVSVSLKDRIRIALWNLRVKSYGTVISQGLKDQGDFKYLGTSANMKLDVQDCTRCHGGEGLFSRQALTRQNFMSIKFMLEKGYMPPMGFSLRSESKRKILRFIGLSE